MAVIESRVDSSSAEFGANRQYFQGLLQELQVRTAQVSEGGGAEAMAKHVARAKLPVRTRIARLIDPQTPFLELSALAAWDMYDGEAPSAGIVTGIGRVAGR